MSMHRRTESAARNLPRRILCISLPLRRAPDAGSGGLVSVSSPPGMANALSPAFTSGRSASAKHSGQFRTSLRCSNASPVCNCRQIAAKVRTRWLEEARLHRAKPCATRFACAQFRACPQPTIHPSRGLLHCRGPLVTYRACDHAAYMVADPPLVKMPLMHFPLHFSIFLKSVLEVRCFEGVVRGALPPRV